MRLLTIAPLIVVVALGSGLAARGQTTRAGNEALSGGQARIETAPLDVSPPDRYRISLLLEPARSVVIKAPDDGVVQNVSARVGDSLREGQEVAQLDGAEARARLAVAKAELDERRAAADAGSLSAAVAQAQVALAQTRVDLAQIAVDRCALRAPFAGVVQSHSVASGQFVARGEPIAVLADLSTLRVLLPVDRSALNANQPIRLRVEGREVEGRVTALVPLPDRFVPLLELPTPWAAAWVEIPSPAAQGLQVGQRVEDPFLPSAPLVVVPTEGVRDAGTLRAQSQVQVIRNQYVLNVPVQVIGEVAPGRLQVSGKFRMGDVAIVGSNVALAEGTFVRFGNAEAGPIQTLPPDPNAVGGVVEIGRGAPPTGATQIAPIGPPGSALPKAASRPAPPPTRDPQGTRRPPGNPAAPPGSIPF